MARTRLRMFEEELETAIESGMKSYSGHTTWNFVNGVLYCLDICTTIGERLEKTFIHGRRRPVDDDEKHFPFSQADSIC